MIKRFFIVFLTFVLAIVGTLLVAKHPTGPNTISYDEPVGLWLSIGMIMVLFLPLLILALFGKRVLRIISAVYQAFVAFSFLVLIPIGFIYPHHIWVSIIAVLGTLVSVISVLVLLKGGPGKAVHIR